MGVGVGLYMYVVVVQKFTFAISSADKFLYTVSNLIMKMKGSHNFEQVSFSATSDDLE